MTSHYNTSSWRDDLDLEPNVHPIIALAIYDMRTARAAELANQRQPWPFPAQPIPIDNKAPPRGPDAEDAPW